MNILTMNANESAVEFASVSKTFDGKSFAVRNLSFDVQKGEFLTLLGPSGSGKTTALLMLAGFEVPTSGEILIQNKSVSGLPPYKRDIGVVFQNYALFPHMTVEENVAFPLIMRGLPKRAAIRKVRQALDLVRLASLGARRPNQLSGGQQQRTALLRALIFDPVLLLMDEPFGALDKKLREEMQIEIRQIHKRLGNTFISVTHDQSEALTMSDRIAIFKDGTLQQIGTPNDIYENPSNSFVAKFIGDTNTLEGVVEKIDKGSCLIRLEDGHVISARAGKSIELGKRAVLSIRPERLVVSQSATGLEGRTNHLKGRVRDSIYLGDHLRHLVEIQNHENWIVKMTGGNKALSISQDSLVDIAWNEQDCLALDCRT